MSRVGPRYFREPGDHRWILQQSGRKEARLRPEQREVHPHWYPGAISAREIELIRKAAW